MEQRKNTRKIFQTNASIVFDYSKIDCTSKDISQGGMFVFSSCFPQVGTEVIVIISIDDEEYKIPATIRWRNQNGFGLQFGLIGAKLTHAINQI